MLIIHRRWCALYFLLIIVFSGAGLAPGEEIQAPTPPTQESQNDILAVVGDKNITRAEFEKELAALNPKVKSQFETPEGRKQFLKELSEIAILELAANKQGLADKPEVKQNLFDTTNNMLAQLYIQDLISKETVSDQDVETFFNEHKSEFCELDRYHLHQITFKDLEMAKKAKSELEKGKSFQEIAKAESIDSFQSSGGDRGFVTLDALSPALAASISVLKPDEVSQPLSGGASGAFLIKYSEKKNGELQELSKVAPSIRRQLASDLPKKVIERVIVELGKEFLLKLEPSNVELLRNPGISAENLEKPLFTIGTESFKIAAVMPDLERIPAFIRGHILEGTGLSDFLKQFYFKELLKRFIEKNFDDLCKKYPDAIVKAKRQVGIKVLLDDNVGKVTFVTDEEMKQFYSKNLKDFSKPEQFQAHHILVEKEEQANNILERIKKGEKFEEIAKVDSKCPSRKDGGDLGNFEKGQMVPEFEEAIANSQVGSLVGPVKTKFGFHIIRVDGKKLPGTQPLEEVKDRIKSQLLPEKQRAAFEHLLEELKKTYPIKDFSDKL